MNASGCSVAKEAVDFVLANSHHYDEIDRDLLERYAHEHMIYGTLIMLRRNGELVAVSRFNWLSHETIEVIDLVIRPDMRSIKMLRWIAIQVKKLYPQWKYFVYDRVKYPERSQRGYEILFWLKLRGE